MLHKKTLKNQEISTFEKLSNEIFIHVIFSYFIAKELLIQKRVSKRYKFFSESALKKSENNIFYAINAESVVAIGKEIQKGSSVTYRINKTVSANQLLESFTHQFQEHKGIGPQLNHGMFLFKTEEKALNHIMDHKNSDLYKTVSLNKSHDDVSRIFVKPIYKVQLIAQKIKVQDYGYTTKAISILDLMDFLKSYDGYRGQYIDISYLIPRSASVKYKLHPSDNSITTLIENVNLRNMNNNDFIAPPQKHTCKIL